MIRNILHRVPAIVLTAGLLGCSSSTYESDAMPEVRQVEVACVQVEGLPEFTEKTCKDLAGRVRQGVKEFHELIDGVVEPSHEVRYRLLSGTVKIDSALERRCINYTDAKPDQKDRLVKLVNITTKAALKQVIDFEQTALVVAVNASTSLCDEELPSDFTERCPDAEAKKAYLAGQALLKVKKKPIAFIFASPPPDARVLDVSLVRHEWGHLGIEKEHLGHDLALCNLDGDRLPTVIDGSANLDTNLRSWKASIMNYTDDAPDIFIAPPHLAQFGLIEEERIIIPEKSGTIILSDAPQPGPGAQQSAAALWLELANPTIEKAIAPEVSKTTLSVADYGLFIGRVTTLSGNTAGVAIYAAPTTEQLRKSDDEAPIFLIQRLSTGEQLDIANGPSIKVIGGDQDVAKIDLQLAG